MSIGAGFVFERVYGFGLGLFVGTITTMIGTSAGAVLSFLIGRYLLRDCMKHLAERYSMFEALDVGTHTRLMHAAKVGSHILTPSVLPLHHSYEKQGFSHHGVDKTVSDYPFEHHQLSIRYANPPNLLALP